MSDETKTHMAVRLFREGQLSAALRIFCTFRIGFTKEEKRTLQIAKESLNGNFQFFRSLGINTDEKIEQSVKILTEKYKKV